MAARGAPKEVDSSVGEPCCQVLELRQYLLIFLSGFLFVSLIFAAEILHALSWPAVLAGNLIALGAMSAYFRRHHPTFKMLP